VDDERRQWVRCQRAASAFAWWGRTSLALWIFEVVMTLEAWLWALPVWILAVGAELNAPTMRREGETTHVVMIHAIALPVFGYLFWFVAEAWSAHGSGRLLAFAFALPAIGLISAWRTWDVRRHAPYRNPGRTPETIDNHLRVARAVRVLGLLWTCLTGVLALAAFAFDGWSAGLQVLGFAGWMLWATVWLFRTIEAGIGVAHGSTLVVVVAVGTLAVAIAVSIGLGGLGFVVLGLPLACAGIAALRLVAGTLPDRPRVPTPWNQDRHRPSDGG